MPDSSSVRILSGDGDSEQTAIRFTPCDVRSRVAAEREYICTRFGPENVEWRRDVHFTRPGQISDWVIQLKDGTTRSVLFSTENTIYDDQ